MSAKNARHGAKQTTEAVQRTRRTVIIFGVSLVLAVVMVAATIRFTGRATPAYFFSVSITDYPNTDRITRVQTNPANMDCLGLGRPDLEALLTPASYRVTINWGDQRYRPDAITCFLRANDASQTALTTWVSLSLRPPNYNGQTVDVYQQAWGAYFFYTFPKSFGWGGALWITPGDGLPGSPSPDNIAYSILCDSQGYCLSASVGRNNTSLVVMLPGEKRKVNPWALQPNANGVFDPLWTVTTLVETAWRQLHAEKPDLLPTALPPVNSSPYEPATTEPFPSSGPGGEPT